MGENGRPCMNLTLTVCHSGSHFASEGCCDESQHPLIPVQLSHKEAKILRSRLSALLEPLRVTVGATPRSGVAADRERSPLRCAGRSPCAAVAGVLAVRRGRSAAVAPGRARGAVWFSVGAHPPRRHTGRCPTVPLGVLRPRAARRNRPSAGGVGGQSLNIAVYGWVMRSCRDPKSTSTAMSPSPSTAMTRPRPYPSWVTRSPMAKCLRGASARVLKGLVGRGRRPAENFVIPASMHLEARARAFPAHSSSSRAEMPRPQSSAPPEWRRWAAWCAAFAGLSPRGQAFRTAGIALPWEPSTSTGCGPDAQGACPPGVFTFLSARNRPPPGKAPAESGVKHPTAAGRGLLQST